MFKKGYKMTKEHRENLSKSCKGRQSWNKGLKGVYPKESLYKNMITHLRFDISLEWIKQFDNIDKLKLLNKCITVRDNRFNVNTEWYKKYIEKFYNDKKFNLIYDNWIKNNKDKYLMPTIDHIKPKSKNGNSDLENLEFLTWFENRCKNNIDYDKWQEMKKNIQDYFI
jgi:5-methylcytosine-specific restriction endonuclease McrA